jgi:ribosomal-protein-alanine N-acetyltransferase
MTMPTMLLLPDEFPRLGAGAFVLRALTRSDAAGWHRILDDPRVNQYTSTPEMSVAEVEGLIASLAEGFRTKTRVRWAITEGGDGPIVGDIGYNVFFDRDQRADVGYHVAPDYWRRGVMTEALAAVLDYGFTVLDLNKVEAGVNVNNERSAGLLRKLGFQLEGTLREHRNRRGVLGDSFSFGLLRREWRQGAPG